MKDRLWHVKALGYALLIGALYFALVHASLWLRVGTKDISFFWAPAGFLLGVLTRCKLRSWYYLIPILLAINILANLMTGRSLGLVLLFTVDDILVPAGAAWILRRFLNDEEPFATATQAIAFLIITGFYAVISSSVGVGAMFWQGLPGPFLNEWRIWATSVLMGVLILAPPILSFSFEVVRALGRRRIIEGIGVQILLIVPTYLAFHQHIASGMPVRLLVYASIPLLIWSALRAGVFGTSISLFVIGAVGVWQIATGDAVLGQSEAELTDNLGWVQAYFAAVSFSSLMVASLFSEFQQSLADRKLQSSVLSMIAAGKPLEATLRELILRIEARLPGMIGSVLLFDPLSKSLSTIAAPHLPEKYNNLITRFPAGPQNGSCGTAAFRKERVIVEDIFNSELWAPYLALAREFNLAACWSQPIMNAAAQVHGTFAMYYHEPRKPTPAELDLIQIAADLAEVAIERDHFISEIRDRERSYAALISNLSGMVYR
jgi:integral membrane sensor domain MASE1